LSSARPWKAYDLESKFRNFQIQLSIVSWHLVLLGARSVDKDTISVQSDHENHWYVFLIKNLRLVPQSSINFLSLHLPSDIDHRCDNRCFWLSTHNCQVPTPTSQNLWVEHDIWIFGAD
jgi:hypothetical protein